MRKLLFSSAIVLSGLMMACHTSEDSVSEESVSADGSEVRLDSSNIELPVDADSLKSIDHGTPDQEKLDSIKKSKEKEKKKG